jgi:hypothetical protein
LKGTKRSKVLKGRRYAKSTIRLKGTRMHEEVEEYQEVEEKRLKSTKRLYQEVSSVEQ